MINLDDLPPCPICGGPLNLYAPDDGFPPVHTCKCGWEHEGDRLTMLTAPWTRALAEEMKRLLHVVDASTSLLADKIERRNAMVKEEELTTDIDARERAAIVAWLRSGQAHVVWTIGGSCQAALADAIEHGKHMTMPIHDVHQVDVKNKSSRASERAEIVARLRERAEAHRRHVARYTAKGHRNSKMRHEYAAMVMTEEANAIERSFQVGNEDASGPDVGRMQDFVREELCRQILEIRPDFNCAEIDGGGSDSNEFDFTRSEIAQAFAAITEDHEPVPRFLLIELSRITRAFEAEDYGSLGTCNEYVQPLVDAVMSRLWRTP